MESFYLSDDSNIDLALELTELDFDELEIIVGRFSKSSRRCGQLRGEVVNNYGRIFIRHHFTKKVLWEKD